MATYSSILAWRIPMERRGWWATVHRVANESDTTERLSAHTPLLQKLQLTQSDQMQISLPLSIPIRSVPGKIHTTEFLGSFLSVVSNATLPVSVLLISIIQYSLLLSQIFLISIFMRTQLTGNNQTTTKAFSSQRPFELNVTFSLTVSNQSSGHNNLLMPNSYSKLLIERTVYKTHTHKHTHELYAQPRQYVLVLETLVCQIKSILKISNSTSFKRFLSIHFIMV